MKQNLRNGFKHTLADVEGGECSNEYGTDISCQKCGRCLHEVNVYVGAEISLEPYDMRTMCMDCIEEARENAE